jgi:hypothetical protein
VVKFTGVPDVLRDNPLAEPSATVSQRTSRTCHHHSTTAASPSATVVVAPYITE